MSSGNESVDRLLEVFDALIHDWMETQELLEKDRRDSIKRTCVVRAMAYIEGLTFALKTLARDNYSAKLSPIEILALEEKQVQVDNSGRIKCRPSFCATLHSLRFAFSLLSRIFAVDLEINYGGKNWQCLKRVAETRNRVVHPKTVHDLKVDDADLDDASHAVRWMTFYTTKLFRVYALSTEAKIDAMRETMNLEIGMTRSTPIDIEKWYVALEQIIMSND